jgi:hypothetical protein
MPRRRPFSMPQRGRPEDLCGWDLINGRMPDSSIKMEVSEHGDTPIWMVYNGKSY